MRSFQCCVPGCSSLRQDVMLHKFPKCEVRLQKWVRSINCDSLKRLSVADIANLHVCHKHFEERFKTAKSRLLGTAYPTLFSADEIDSGIPKSIADDVENINPLRDHDYVKRSHFDHTYAKPSALGPHRSNVLSVGATTSACVETPLPGEETASKMNVSVGATTSACVETPLPGEETASKINVSVGATTSACAETPQPGDKTASKTIASGTLQSSRKKRIAQTVESLTPKCKILYKEYRKSKKLLSYTRRAKRAIKFSTEHAFEEQISEMNPLARKILLMQVRLCTKNTKGRRFSLEEKIIALSILKQGTKAYNFLRRIFILPSKTTLKKAVQGLNIEPGINLQIMQSIKEEVNAWNMERKYCSIIFDEMALEPGLTYTQHLDKIVGFVELTKRANKFADHALVFMVKGIVHKWQQPIAYYFCEGATSALDLKKILKEVVSAVGDTGLIPLALIADQGTAFQSALRSLQEDTKRAQSLAQEHIDETIEVEGFKLSVIADPPHLIKGIRNNFLTKEVCFEGKRAKWMDIVDVYNTDCQHADMRLLHKLNDEHVLPEKIKKMKVKNCVRVFSKTVASALTYTSAFSHYADGRPVSATIKNTAEVVSFLDDLFDSVNGSSVFCKKSKGKELRSAVTSSSRHHNFWKNCLIRLNNFKFIDAQGHEKIVPSIKNWITTIKSFQRLWQFLQTKGVKVMRPRYLNSDAIENFFGQVRAYNFRNVNPDCHTFSNTFKSLLITGFIKFHHASFNCEEDGGEQLLKMMSLFKSLSNTVTDKKRDEIAYNEASSDLVADSVLQARKERLSVHARAYTAGWVLRKMLSKHQCRECKLSLTTNSDQDIHAWINHREYKTLKQRKLTYPSEHTVRYFGTIVEKSNEYLEINGDKDRISLEIKKDLQDKFDFQLGCQRHKEIMQNAFLSFTVRLSIFNWIKIINQILRGVDVVRLERRNNLPPMQKKAIIKYKKKFVRRK